MYSSYYESPLGQIFLTADDRALTGAWFEGQKHYPASLPAVCDETADCKLLHVAQEWLDAYFSGKKPAISALRLAPAGSDFARLVWSILCEIPYGCTITYDEIAKRVAKERGVQHMSAQAVGGAVERNPISVIIPCHRVIGKDKAMTGYAGGIDRKVRLFAHEGVPTGFTSDI